LEKYYSIYKKLSEKRTKYIGEQIEEELFGKDKKH